MEGDESHSSYYTLTKINHLSDYPESLRSVTFCGFFNCHIYWICHRGKRMRKEVSGHRFRSNNDVISAVDQFLEVSDLHCVEEIRMCHDLKTKCVYVGEKLENLK